MATGRKGVDAAGKQDLSPHPATLKCTTSSHASNMRSNRSSAPELHRNVRSHFDDMKEMLATAAAASARCATAE
jgi:hypothetical protein